MLEVRNNHFGNITEKYLRSMDHIKDIKEYFGIETKEGTEDALAYTSKP